MAVYSATDHSITINGTNFSDHLQSVDVSYEAAELETTAFGTAWRSRVGGLKSASITLNFFQDFAAGSVDAVLFPLLGSNATVIVKATSSATGSANPAHSAVYLVSQYQPFASQVGDIATISVTWNSTGTATRSVS